MKVEQVGVNGWGANSKTANREGRFASDVLGVYKHTRGPLARFTVTNLKGPEKNPSARPFTRESTNSHHA